MRLGCQSTLPGLFGARCWHLPSDIFFSSLIVTSSMVTIKVQWAWLKIQNSKPSGMYYEDGKGNIHLEKLMDWNENVQRLFQFEKGVIKWISKDPIEYINNGGWRHFSFNSWPHSVQRTMFLLPHPEEFGKSYNCKETRFERSERPLLASFFKARNGKVWRTLLQMK